jgi:UDP-glucose-4-epimerase GalE
VKVLVTGGSGYVGSHVAKLLKEKGHIPFVIDKDAEDRKWATSTIGTFHGDIADYVGLNKIFETYKFDAVIHLAASSEVGPSVTNPLMYYANNVSNTALLIGICLQHGVDKFIFSSTSAVYGQVPVHMLPTVEEYTKNPATSYGASKLCVEYMLRDVSVAHGMRSVALRYFNASGAAPDASIGEFRKTPTHLIPSLAAVATGKRETFTFNGTDYPTEDGTPIRDYTHVWDIAEAHVKALEYLDKGGATTALNIGAGEGTSVQEMYEEFAKQWGEHIPFTVGEKRPGDIAINFADISLAKETIGWEPVRSTPQQIIEDAIRWYRSDTYKRISND